MQIPTASQQSTPQMDFYEVENKQRSIAPINLC